ncbi:MAG: MCE family protein [Gordonia sp.]|uniref:MCE family protein n=1 Tax=Gordonia rubripertincta TaxID=36822 RepID=A0ABT4MZS9_GORRU|nr:MULTISPECIES: MCE family protein [Mycobacteriales]MBA4026415.1 MCE family protein [Gordonia sp. (in: high G+C Gram-positive bacteria)]MCZ4551716.1 MCE family protein [Gordonia rubripertincta]OZG28009.1 mammalian cell entry protein [Williamsia sp. 1138]
MQALKRRALGLVFFLVVALFLTLTIMQYNKSFTKFVDVKLQTTSAGNALPNNADVKARGLIVGEVRSVEPNLEDGSVVVTLGLQPDKVDLLPTDTTARILPKTLFGERYVALQIPDGQEGNKGDHLSNGSTIDEDKSGNAVELQELFDQLLPVLDAIPPADLNVTLSALSKALAGNGERLGASFEQLNTVFKGINENMPELQGTLRGLASFSQTYSEALPDLIDSLDTLRTTTNTLVERQGDLRTVIAAVTQVAIDGTGFLETNRRDLVDLAIQSEPLLTALAKQSPAFGCTFKNFAGLVPEANVITGAGTENPGVRVNLQFVNPRGRYLPNQDEPRLFDERGPICYAQPSNGRPFPQYPAGSVNDGSYQPPSRNAGPRNVPTLPEPQYSAMPDGTSAQAQEPATNYSDPRNKLQIQAIVAAAAGKEPAEVPSWIGLIAAPTVQGQQVSIR